MDYKARRIKSGISRYTLAKELNTTEEKIKNLENGGIELKGNFIEKFINATKEKNKELVFNQKVKIEEINKWINSGQAKEDINKMGYSLADLSRELGFSSGYVSYILSYPNRNVSSDAKEKLYDFVMNPLNKKISNCNKNKTNIIVEEVKEPNAIEKDFIDSWVESGQAKLDITISDYTQDDLSVELFGRKKGYVSNIISKRRYGKDYEQKQKLFDFLHKEDADRLNKLPPENEETLENTQENCENEIHTTPDEIINNLENKTNKKVCEIGENKDKIIETLEKRLYEIEKENTFLKESIKRLFNLN